MALPARIRVNTQFPFPALVKASVPITVTKANGNWSIGLNIAQLGAVNPPINRLVTDFVLVWDAVSLTFVKVALSSIVALYTGARNQRTAIVSPIVIASTDMIVNISINAGAPTCALPAAATRLGQPLTFKDAGGFALAHNVTFTPNGAELIDGLASVKLTANYQSLTLVPYNDGTNTGWAVE